MAAYVDGHESRFKVGPIRGVLSESLDCGFLTPRGCRMFETRPVSRMRAGHGAPARDILQIHSDFFMAVYGYGKMHAQLVAQGRDPAGAGRGQVMNIMRELGIRGVRRGKTPGDDGTRQGHGRQAGSGGREVRGLCAGPPARGRHRPRAHGQRLVRLHGVRRRRVRPSDRGMGVRHDREHAGAAVAGVGAGGLMGRVPWWRGWSYPPQRPWHAVHRHGVHHQGYGIWDAAVDRHRRRLV